MSTYELGVINASPLKFAFLQLKTIYKTWAYCRKNNKDRARWEVLAIAVVIYFCIAAIGHYST